MAEFLEIIFSLPTAVFTYPLILVVLYWGVALAGLFNLEWFDGAAGTIDAVDGVGGSLDGAIDGGLAKLEGGLAKLEGLSAKAEGLSAKVEGVSAKVEGGLAKLEAALPDGSVEAAPAGAESMPGALDRFGMGGVPRSYSGSLMILFGWTFSVLGSYYVPGFQELGKRGLWLALMLAFASLLLGMAATAVAIQPLRRAMEAGYGPVRRDLLGQMCTVTTQRVDSRFGQAELDDGSSLIQVRSREATDLTRGSRAVIFDYDVDLEVFLVAPVELDA